MPDEPQQLPAWLLALLSQPRGERTTDAPVRPAPDHADWAAQDTGQYWLDKALGRAVPNSNRNEIGLWLACQLRDAGLSYGEAEHWVREYATLAPGRGYSDSEALASLKQAYTRPARDAARNMRRASSSRITRTDGANALAD